MIHINIWLIKNSLSIWIHVVFFGVLNKNFLRYDTPVILRITSDLMFDKMEESYQYNLPIQLQTEADSYHVIKLNSGLNQAASIQFAVKEFPIRWESVKIFILSLIFLLTIVPQSSDHYWNEFWNFMSLRNMDRNIDR